MTQRTTALAILIGVLLFLHLLATDIGRSDILMQRIPRGFMLLPLTLPSCRAEAGPRILDRP